MTPIGIVAADGHVRAPEAALATLDPLHRAQCAKAAEQLTDSPGRSITGRAAIDHPHRDRRGTPSALSGGGDSV